MGLGMAPGTAGLATSRPKMPGTSMSTELSASLPCKELLCNFYKQVIQVISILDQRCGSFLRSPLSLPECWMFSTRNS